LRTNRTTGVCSMLIRRLRQVLAYEAATGAVKYFGDMGEAAAPQRVGPALPQYAPYTDVVRVRSGHTGEWTFFLAELVGAPGSDEYMSTQDAAARLGVEDRTVRRWAKAGKLDAVRTAGGDKRPGSWRVSRAAVSALLAEPDDLNPGAAKLSRPAAKRRKTPQPLLGQLQL